MLDEAVKFFGQMMVRGMKPDTFTLNILPNAYCKSGKVEFAIKLLNSATSLGLSTNAVGYNSLLKGICEWKDLEEPFFIFTG